MKRWDFPALQHKLVKSIPELKRDALTLSLRCNSREIVDRKVEVLKARIWKVATIAGAGGAIPIVGLLAEGGVIAHEVMEYKQQLGLDKETLKGLAKRHKIEVGNLAAIEGMKDIAKAIALTASVFVSVFLPIFLVAGSVIGVGMSYGITVRVLQDILSELHKAALQILELVIEQKSDF